MYIEPCLNLQNKVNMFKMDKLLIYAYIQFASIVFNRCLLKISILFSFVLSFHYFSVAVVLHLLDEGSAVKILTDS